MDEGESECDLETTVVRTSCSFNEEVDTGKVSFDGRDVPRSG
jgi:hypothetical protein